MPHVIDLSFYFTRAKQVKVSAQLILPHSRGTTSLELPNVRTITLMTITMTMTIGVQGTPGGGRSENPRKGVAGGPENLKTRNVIPLY